MLKRFKQIRGGVLIVAFAIWMMLKALPGRIGRVALNLLVATLSLSKKMGSAAPAIMALVLVAMPAVGVLLHPSTWTWGGG